MENSAKSLGVGAKEARTLPRLTVSVFPVLRTWLRRARFFVNAVCLLPHLALFRHGPNRDLIAADLDRWRGLLLRGQPEISRSKAFLLLMIKFPEYRNLFYHRLGQVGRLVVFLRPPSPTLYLCTEHIGPGLFIQHGFSTIVYARRIGANCWINQQVTIGAANGGLPTLGDNVTVCAGAKVLGDVVVGDGAVIGANAVVVKTVPPNTTVVGVPAYIVRRDGRKVREPL